MRPSLLGLVGVGLAVWLGFRNMFWVFGLVNIQRGGEASIGENVGFT